MTDSGADPWPTDPTGSYPPDTAGRATTTTAAPPEDEHEPTTLALPTVISHPPIVLSPEPTVGLTSPTLPPLDAGQLDLDAPLATPAHLFDPPAQPSPLPQADDRATTFGDPPVDLTERQATSSPPPPPPFFQPERSSAPPPTIVPPDPTAPTAATMSAPTELPAPETPTLTEPTLTQPALLAPPIAPTVAPTLPLPAPQTSEPDPALPVFASPPAAATVRAPSANSTMHWNWAGGCVLGLSILCLVFAAPRFAVAADQSQLGQQTLGDWLLYGSALGSILTVISLASRRIVVVATLSLTTAAVAVAAVIKLQGDWNLSHNTTWASLGLVLGLAALGIASSVGLRRTT